MTIAGEDQTGEILSQDARGRVLVSRERRESLLAEYDRSGMSGVRFAQYLGIKYTTLGRFSVTHVFERPAGMPNFNNEGFTMAPQAECVGNLKPAFWADDTEDDGHAIRRGSLTCMPF
jgi:hypothetical protein